MCNEFNLKWIVLILKFVIECSSQTLLLATETGIKILEPTTASLTTVHEHAASAVDFRYNSNDVYFISKNQIFYSYFSRYSNNHAEPISIITTGHSLTDLVVDWRGFKLYYSSSNNSAIYESALLGSTISPFTLTSSAILGDLAVDVYVRKLFYIKNSALYSTSLQVRDNRFPHFVYRFSTETHSITTVSKLAVNHHHRQVFVVGYDDDHLQWHLVRTDYNNTESTLVFNGPELAQPFALTVFDQEVLWGSHAHGIFTLYSCKLTPACDIDHLEIIYQSAEAINDVKFYNPLVQTPDTDTACRELDCSHNCSVVSPYTVKCSCPPGMIVEPDGKICKKELMIVEEKSLEEWAQDLKMTLLLMEQAALEWADSMKPHIEDLILVICVIMIALLSCGMCMLMCARPPKNSVKRSESYDLAETRQRTVSVQ